MLSIFSCALCNCIYLDTYNYVFEMIDNKLTLVDFYINNDGINTSGSLLNLISKG